MTQNRFYSRGPVFAADFGGVSGGTQPGLSATQASPSSAQASLSGGQSSSDMQAMFSEGIAEQTKMYKIGFQQKKITDELQTFGDAMLKTLKPVSE